MDASFRAQQGSKTRGGTPMTDSRDPLMTARDDLQLLASDLACVSGTLSEIATAWRRAQQDQPGLPLGLPMRLGNATRQLATAVQALADAGPNQPPDLAFSVAEQLSALKDDIASAEALTCSPGIPPVGDAQLWEHLNAAVQRAGTRLLSLILHRVKIKDWSLSGPAGTGVPGTGPGLLVELG
jgi:hypothetical protein